MARITKAMLKRMIENDYTVLYNPMTDEMKATFPVVTVGFLEDIKALHVTVNHQGKMSGFQSLSTTCKCNDICVKRIASALAKMDIDSTKDAKEALRNYIKEHPLATDISICGFCFSDTLQDRQKTMTEPLERNYHILNDGIIHTDWLPVLNVLFFRGESFGDFASVNAVVNMYNLARKNPLVNFTAWTKNPVFFHLAEKQGYSKPNNFKLVLSSQYINRQTVIPEAYKHLIDAVFTVYTEEYARINNITINCGARACLSCLRCYTGYNGTVKVINELLK